MTWHFPDDDNEVIDERLERIITYAAIWFLLCGAWKTLEIFAFIGGFIKWP